MQATIKDIRTQLRRAMNGVVSTSMLEKGVVYKLNYGVSLPEIKRIATMYQPSDELAATLWKEDIREFKLLATFLQPVDSFTHKQALLWIQEIPYLEIAEQLSRNLLAKLPDADDLAVELVFKEDEYARTVAYLLWSQLYMNGHSSIEPRRVLFFEETSRSLGNEAFAASWKEKQAALKALKSYGRQSKKQAEEVLRWFESIVLSGTLEQKEFYNDLKFEFEYYF